MIDLHCHILPEIDDGPASIEESITMAKVAAAEGIHTIVATPHIYSSHPSALAIQNKTQQLQQNLEECKIPLSVHAGAEIAYNCLNLDLKNFTFPNSTYLLIEFPHNFLPSSADQDLFDLLNKGFKPIIAHPERNQTIIEQPDLLIKLMQENIHLQLTANSITGDFGTAVRDCAWYLLQQKVVSFIASDAHSPNRRKPSLKEAVKKAGKIIGKKKALDLVTKNPEFVLNNISF